MGHRRYRPIQNNYIKFGTIRLLKGIRSRHLSNNLTAIKPPLNIKLVGHPDKLVGHVLHRPCCGYSTGLGWGEEFNYAFEDTIN